MTKRKITQVVEGIKTSDGGGVNLTRIIGTPELNVLDPFLLLDEFFSDNPDDYIAGFPPHPHRGFETITYMMNGRFHHQDSAGNEGSLKDGSVQWMTAGRGVIHSEMPEQTEGLMRGFQLWLNLPKKEKMIDPAYQDIHTKMIPLQLNSLLLQSLFHLWSKGFYLLVTIHTWSSYSPLRRKILL